MTDKRVGDALYSHKHDGNITDALFEIARALHMIAVNVNLSDRPFTLGEEVNSGLMEIARAIRPKAILNKE